MSFRTSPVRHAFVAIALFALCASPLLAQVTVSRPRVLVVPLTNLTGQSQNDVVAATSTDTIELTLRLLDQYEVSVAENLSSGDLIDADDQELETLSAERGVDNIMFGSVDTTDDGGFVFNLAVYDRAAGEISLRSQSRSDSLFGVFDASDELVADAVSGFSGVRIGFGSLRVTSQGNGDFILYVDDRRIGENVTAVDRLLIGERTIQIRQIRGEREATIYTQTVNVAEGSTSTVSFTFPQVTDDEIALEASLRTRLQDLLAVGTNPDEIDTSIARLRELYERLPGVLEGSINDIPLYEDRRWLAAEMQGLSDYDYRALAAQTGGEQVDRTRAIFRGWMDMWSEYDARAENPDPDSPVGSWTPEEQFERIELDVERNFQTLNGFITLGRALVVEQEDWTLVDGFNRIRRVARPTGSLSVRFHSWAAESAVASDAVQEYRRADERRRPFWHWIAGTIGVGALGYAGYGMFIADTSGLQNEIEQNIAAYEAATDYDTIVSLRSQIDSDVDRLNRMETIPLYAAAGGGVFLSTAIVGRVVSSTRPNRVWRRYRKEPVVQQWTAAGLDYRDAQAGDPGSALLVLGASIDRVRDMDTGENYTAPVVLPSEPGKTWRLEYPNARLNNDIVEFEITTGDGITVMTLGVE